MQLSSAVKSLHTKLSYKTETHNIRKNYDWLTENKIEHPRTRIAMLHDFDDPRAWASNSPLSYSLKGRYVWNEDLDMNEFVEFKNEADFNKYMRYIEKWSGRAKNSRYETRPDVIKDKYIDKFILVLEQIAIHNSITLPNGKVPSAIKKELKKLTMEQITNIFGVQDPTEDVEVSQIDSDDFADVVDGEGMVDTVMGRINAIKTMHPGTETKFKLPKKKKRKKRKKKK